VKDLSHCNQARDVNSEIGLEALLPRSFSRNPIEELSVFLRMQGKDIAAAIRPALYLHRGPEKAAVHDTNVSILVFDDDVNTSCHNDTYAQGSFRNSVVLHITDFTPAYNEAPPFPEAIRFI
jgi:hypothetical protein